MSHLRTFFEGLIRGWFARQMTVSKFWSAHGSSRHVSRNTKPCELPFSLPTYLSFGAQVLRERGREEKRRRNLKQTLCAVRGRDGGKRERGRVEPETD